MNRTDVTHIGRLVLQHHDVKDRAVRSEVGPQPLRRRLEADAAHEDLVWSVVLATAGAGARLGLGAVPTLAGLRPGRWCRHVGGDGRTGRWRDANQTSAHHQRHADCRAEGDGVSVGDVAERRN